jgi:hypothetical protein
MFKGASAFNQPLDRWDMSPVTSIEGILKMHLLINCFDIIGCDYSSLGVENHPTDFACTLKLVEMNVILKYLQLACMLSVYH